MSGFRAKLHDFYALLCKRGEVDCGAKGHSANALTSETVVTTLR